MPINQNSSVSSLLLILPILFILIAGCSHEAALSERDPFAEPERQAKDDDLSTSSCGSCSWSLCGLDCSMPGQECEYACSQEDTRDQTFVRAVISGGVSDTIDSRDQSDDYSQFLYGCQWWNFSDGLVDGFEIKYFESNRGDYGRRWFVYLEPFAGPGSYIASEVYFSESITAHRAGEYFYAEDTCSVDVSNDGAGGLKGSFQCLDVGSHTEGRVSISGDFACGRNALLVPSLRFEGE